MSDDPRCGMVEMTTRRCLREHGHADDDQGHDFEPFPWDQQSIDTEEERSALREALTDLQAAAWNYVAWLIAEDYSPASVGAYLDAAWVVANDRARGLLAATAPDEDGWDEVVP